MLRPSDQEYKQTRLIKLGKTKMDEKFTAFAEWINEKYAVQILNVHTDVINENTFRLQLIFEHEAELSKFFLKDRFTASKQIINTIDKKYKEMFQITNSHPLLVLFYAFEPLAKEEANTNISPETITFFKEKYKDMLWQISRFGQHTTFFFYTKTQLKKAQKSGLVEKIKQAYFEVLKQHDEFHYFTINNFNAVFDSKENFDKTYQGNWRAYYN